MVKKTNIFYAGDFVWIGTIWVVQKRMIAIEKSKRER